MKTGGYIFGGLAFFVLLFAALGAYEHVSALFIISNYNPHSLAMGRGNYTLWCLVGQSVITGAVGTIVWGVWLVITSALNAKYNKRQITKYCVLVIIPALILIPLGNLVAVVRGNWNYCFPFELLTLLWALAALFIRRARDSS